jgi:hypothetical protein
LIPGFEKIVEERIRRAQREGAFDELDGSGSPLELEADGHIAPDLRLAHKILKNADCLPPEIEMKKEIQRTEELLAGLPDTAEKHRILKKLNFLILKLNNHRQGDISRELPQRYLGEVVERMSTKAERLGQGANLVGPRAGRSGQKANLVGPTPAVPQPNSHASHTSTAPRK